MIHYRIFYGDGSEFDSIDDIGLPPARNVQVILQWDDSGPFFQTRGDFYIRWPESARWVAVDPGGFFDFAIEMGWLGVEDTYSGPVIYEAMRQALLSGRCLFGRTITNAHYKAIVERAKVVKTTWRSWEPRPK